MQGIAKGFKINRREEERLTLSHPRKEERPSATRQASDRQYRDRPPPWQNYGGNFLEECPENYDSLEYDKRLNAG